MTKPLTTKLRQFIKLMQESDEQAKWGFESLLKRQDPEQYFDHLYEAGLFDAVRNPSRVLVTEIGAYQVPYWNALPYLEYVARKSGAKNDLVLSEKIMGVIRSVTNARENDGSICDNHHTFQSFANIIGLLPTSAIGASVIDLIPVWLSSQFDTSMVCHTLDRGVITKLLASESPEDWDKAIEILGHCTAIKWVDKTGFNRNYKKPVTIVDDYWLHKLVSRHSATLGNKVPKKTARILLKRLHEVFSRYRSKKTWVWRPAVEDNEQNHKRYRTENIFVEGFRDVLVSWVAQDKLASKRYIAQRLMDRSEIVRRIAIYV